MKVNTKDWFDGGRICKKGEPYIGDAKKGHFEDATEEEKKDLGNLPLLSNVKKALLSLDHEDNKLWTNAGLPVVKEVEAIVGQGVTREIINEAFPSFRRDVKALGGEKTILPSAK